MTSPERLALVGGILLDPERSGEPGEAGTLLVEGGRLAGRLPPDEEPGESWRRVAVPGLGIAPGFVDLHFHGELVSGRAEAFGSGLAAAAERLVRGGTTAFLATTLAWSRDALPGLVEALASEISRREEAAKGGARCLGIHLEGPWISGRAAGAMDPACLRPFDPDADGAALDAAGGWLRMVTLAPERGGADALLTRLARDGVLAALGHTNASAAEIDRAVDAGARHVTHLFNAMGPVHHRAPGVAGHVLARDALSCDLICDGHHVHPDMVRVAARALEERLVLISDRVDPPDWSPEAGTASGEPVRLADGTIAGSQLALGRGVANLCAFAALPLTEALPAATLRPARLLGLESEIGTLRDGARADLALLDGEGRVVSTWVGGRPVHESVP